MRRYLLVDDNPTSRRHLATSILRAVGTERDVSQIVEAADATTALEALAKGTFDAVFLDMTFPSGAAGVDVLTAILKCQPDARVVLTAALLVEHPTVVTAISFGMFRYLGKPVRPDGVQAVLKELVTDGATDERHVGRIPPWSSGATRGRA